MAEKDITEKNLEAFDDVFADIVNVLLFNGKMIVKEEDLSDMTPVSQYKIDQKPHEQERDVAKYWHKSNVRIAIYGLENQTDIDRDMPLRILSYDGAAYRAQLNSSNKDESGHIFRYPVVTMVLYFGKTPWNTPRSLYDRLKIPEELRPYVSDYKINVFEICRLTDEQVNMFQSDFKVVADYFVQTYRDKTYVPMPHTVKHVREVLTLLGVLIGDPDIEKAFDRSDLKGKDGAIFMESVWSRTMEEKLNEGIAIGERRSAARIAELEAQLAQARMQLQS